MKNAYYFFLFVLTFQIVSCEKLDINKISSNPWNPSIGAPLLDATFSPFDIISKIDSTGIVGFKDKVLTMNFVNKADTFSLDKILTTHEINLEKKIKIPFTLPNSTIIPNGVVYTANKSDYFELDLDGNQLTEAILKSGNLELIITSTFKNKITLDYQILSLKNQSNNLVSGKFNDLSKQQIISIADLRNYKLNLFNDNKNNTIKFVFKVTLTGANQAFSTSDYINVQLRVRDYKFKSATGKFSLKDTTSFSIINNDDIENKNAVFGFTNPRLKLSIDNKLGIGLKVNKLMLDNEMLIESLEVKNSDKKDFLFSKDGHQEANYESKTISKLATLLTNSQSNKKERLFEYELSSSPDGTITDEQFLLVRSEVELPFEGYVKNLAIVDTVDFELGDTKEINMKQLVLNLNIINKFPVSLKGSLQLLDENQQPIRDSKGIIDLLDLKQQKEPGSLVDVFKAGELDNEGNIVRAGESMIPIILNEKYIAYLQKAKFIKIKATLNTIDDKSDNKNIKIVKFMQSNSIRLRVSVASKISPNIPLP